MAPRMLVVWVWLLLWPHKLLLETVSLSSTAKLNLLVELIEQDNLLKLEVHMFMQMYLGVCQNYVPFLDPYYTAPDIQGTQKGTHNFDNHPYI